MNPASLMNWTLIVVLLFVFDGGVFVEGDWLPPVYWDVDDPRFNKETGLRVNINDVVDVFCPRIVDDNLQRAQYHAVYEVSRDGFLNCDSTDSVRRVLICSRPYDIRRLTMVFREINPAPWGPEFTIGETYYYISTSNNTMRGLLNRRGGSCIDDGMKLTIHIIDPNAGKDDNSNALVDFDSSGVNGDVVNRVPHRGNNISPSNPNDIDDNHPNIILFNEISDLDRENIVQDELRGHSQNGAISRSQRGAWFVQPSLWMAFTFIIYSFIINTT